MKAAALDPADTGAAITFAESRGARKLGNLALLAASFGLGQGSIFLVQTYLVATGKLDLLAAFGTAFSFAILALLLIDFGALPTLARTAAAAQAGQHMEESTSRAFWAASAVRASLAIASIALAVLYATTIASPFERWYIICALPAAAMSAFNAAGLLDGYRLSGVSGLLGSAPYLLSAIALFAGADLDAPAAGALMGAALSGGGLACVAGQLLCLRGMGRLPRLQAPTKADLRAYWRDGGGAFMTMLPGQLFFRFQLLLAAGFLGPSGTALFVYARQVIVGAAQLVALARRVELPELAAEARSYALTGRQILGKQALGTWIAVTLGAVVALGAAVCGWRLDGAGRDAGWLVLAFSVLIPASALGLAFNNGLMALGQFIAASGISIGATAIGALLSLPLVVTLGAFGLGLAELIAFAVQAGLAGAFLARMSRRGAR